MGIVYWLKQKRIIKRIVHMPLLSMLREQVEAVYSRYVFMLSRIGKPEPISNGERCPLLLVTIAFNHEGLVRKQIEMARQNVSDAAFQHIIVDNSSDKSKRRAIRTVCKEQGVEYFAVPRRITWLTWTTLFAPCYSHGAALNWAYRHVIQPRRPVLFALLDHDILPMKTYNLTASLGTQDFYGVDRMRECGWYLWPGWSIFRFDAIADKQVDFSPVHIKHSYLDTGGRNFLSIFCHYYRTDLRFPTYETLRMRITPSLHSNDDIFHGDCIQLVDKAWIHIVNGSNYAHINGKETMVAQMIEKMR